MTTALQRIQRVIAIHGVLVTIRLCISKTLQWLTPVQRREPDVRQDGDLEFDQQWGTDTGGNFIPDKAEVIGPNWKYGARYQGCNATALAKVLAGLPIEHQRFQFVDLGCGKGRAILVAARFPFRKIVGVEYSDQLCQVARHNVSCFPTSERRCKEIEIICADAASFQFSEDLLLIFLFNPFGRKVMNRVVQNVSASYRRNPRRIIVVYFNAQFADSWKEAGFTEEIRRSPPFPIAIYDTKSRNAPQ
jgi:SAM-dependent methyltransferase